MSDHTLNEIYGKMRNPEQSDAQITESLNEEHGFGESDLGPILQRKLDELKTSLSVAIIPLVEKIERQAENPERVRALAETVKDMLVDLKNR
jgi:hypothetical protein